MGARVSDAYTSVGRAMIDGDYGPGTRSFHIGFHFTTHAYEGHNLHHWGWGWVMKKAGPFQEAKGWEGGEANA